MGLWVMALLISSSIICTTDYEAEAVGNPGSGCFWLCVCFYIVLYVFIKQFFFRKIRDGDHLQSLA